MKHKLTIKLIRLLLTVTLFFTLISCDTKILTEAEEVTLEVKASDTLPSVTEIASSISNTAISPKDENKDMISVTILVENTAFIAKFFDTETTQSLITKMPITIDMSDVNGNEKVHQLSENLPSLGTEKPDIIHAGEIMCWSENNLVLFYDTFENTYGGYVRLGYVENVSGLVSALGEGNVSVTFSLDE